MALREVPFLIAATLLHLAVPVAAEIIPVPLTVRPLLASYRLRTTEIAVDVSYEHRLRWHDQLPPDAFPLGDPRVLPQHAFMPRDQWRHLPPDRTSHPFDEPPPDALDMPEGPEGPTPPSEYDLPPVITGVDGTWGWPGGGRSWALTPGGIPRHPSDPAPTRPGRRRAVDPKVATRVIEQAIRAKDRTLGLDLPAAATVASLVGGAVRAADTPAECVGRIAVTLGPDGRLQSVNLLSYSGGGGRAWQQVVRSVRAQLANRKFAMRSSFPKGAIVTVTARSRLRMPSGSGGRQGLGLSFDPSNIGASPKRLVTTSVSVQAIR